MKKDILKERIPYKPFEYQQAADYWLQQNQAHWLPTEVPLANDLTDWNQNLSKLKKILLVQF